MREILFKAKRTDNGEWIEGMPTYDLKYMFAYGQLDSYDNYEVISSTICQFTGLLDKEGNKIFEGDKLKYWGGIGIVIFKDGSFQIFHDINEIGEQDFVNITQAINSVITGNIHDK